MRRLLRDLIDEIGDDGLFDAAASVAFWLLLSLPAALLTALSAVSLVGDDLASELRQSALDFIERTFADQADTLSASVDSLFDQTRPAVLSTSIAIAVFTLSRGFAGLIRALDAVYDVEETRNFIHTRVLGIGLAIGNLATVAVSTALWSYGASTGSPFFVRALLGGLVLVGWAATMFHIGPNHHTPWRYDLPGAVVAAVGWAALSAGYGWYVSIVGSGNQFVGATGALLLGLTWLWAACVVFLVGGELNQLLAQRAGVISGGRSIAGRAGRALRSSLPRAESGSMNSGADDAGIVEQLGRDGFGPDVDGR